jgi:hypothetical protein
MDEGGMGEALALGARKALRVVQFLEESSARTGGEALQVEQNPRRHDRAGQASTAYLVDACDQANAACPVVGKEGRGAQGARLFNPNEDPFPVR